MSRTVLHCDMNNFFASVECRKEPELFTKPLAVCGRIEDRHGIVLAKNYEAKKFGIVTGEPVVKALAKCPQLIIKEPHYDEYIYFSGLAKKIYLEYTDMVEPFGADECWLDVTGSRALFGDGEKIAHTIRNRIKNELGLTISVGVSFNKVFAKLGSDMKKPDAVTVVGEDDFREKIWCLPASSLIGVGRATEAALDRCCIRTIGDLARAYPPLLKSKLGINGVRLIEIANGRDQSPVADQNYQPPLKSISHGTTTPRDVTTLEEAKAVMLALCEDIGHRLLLAQKKARGVSIFLRDNTLVTRQYQCALPLITDSYSVIAQTAFELMKEKHIFDKPLRSITVGAINLIPADTPCQMSLFTDERRYIRKESLDRTMDKINNRFGRGKIRYGALIADPLSDVGEGFGFGRVASASSV